MVHHSPCLRDSAEVCRLLVHCEDRDDVDGDVQPVSMLGTFSAENLLALSATRPPLLDRDPSLRDGDVGLFWDGDCESSGSELIRLSTGSVAGTLPAGLVTLQSTTAGVREETVASPAVS